jgi:hypothetical protein
MYNTMNNTLKDSEQLFSHLVVDGKEIYEDHYDYISDHILGISIIQVIVLTKKQMFDNILLSTDEYLTRSIPFVRRLADVFYQQPTQDSWLDFEQLMEGLQWLSQMVQSINQLSKTTLEFSHIHYSFEVEEVISNLADALQNGDTLLIGDHLKYELLALMDNLAGAVTITIDSEVMRHDLN